MATCELAVHHPVYAYVRQRIQSHRRSIPAPEREACVNYLAERDILAGDLAEARVWLDSYADVDTSLLRGMLELLSGSLPAARRAYDEAVRKVGKTRDEQLRYLQSFPALLHTLLLVQSDWPQDHQQARRWLKWALKERYATPYALAYGWLEGLLSFHEGRRMETEQLRSLRVSEMPLTDVGLTCFCNDSGQGCRPRWSSCPWARIPNGPLSPGPATCT